jgi:hypothetical protein
LLRLVAAEVAESVCRSDPSLAHEAHPPKNADAPSKPGRHGP